MIRVEAKRLKEYLFRREQSLIARTDISSFDARRHLWSPGVLAIVLGVTLFVFSFFSRISLILFLSQITCLAVLFFRTRFIAQRISIQRIVPSRLLRELDAAEVIVEIRNRSDFEASAVLVDDVFGATKSPAVRLSSETLGARSMRRLSYKRVCDGGMGIHQIGPLVARLSDALGLFEFRIVEDKISNIEIQPRVERVPALAVRPSADSARYGNYEVATRGLSVNFSGIRPYERGDSLRHIAWKLSTRGQGLMVKEFEKVVNCDVNIVLNMAPAWQIGRHSASTWEYGKDIALSIIQQQLDLGNTVAFFSDDAFVEAGAGPDHFHNVSRQVARLQMPLGNSSFELEPRPVLQKYRDFYARGSNVIYVTPFNLAEFRHSEPWLRRLRAEGFAVTCIFIDTNSFWLQFIESISTGLLIGAKLMLGLEDIVKSLEAAGIVTYVAKNKQPLKDSLRPRVAV